MEPARASVGRAVALRRATRHRARLQSGRAVASDRVRLLVRREVCRCWQVAQNTIPYTLCWAAVLRAQNPIPYTLCSAAQKVDKAAADLSEQHSAVNFSGGAGAAAVFGLKVRPLHPRALVITCWVVLQADVALVGQLMHIFRVGVARRVGLVSRRHCALHRSTLSAQPETSLVTLWHMLCFTSGGWLGCERVRLKRADPVSRAPGQGGRGGGRLWRRGR